MGFYIICFVIRQTSQKTRLIINKNDKTNEIRDRLRENNRIEALEGKKR